MKQVQIPQELFVQLIHYHLMEDDSYMDEIKIGLEKKLDAMVLRELYGNRDGTGKSPAGISGQAGNT